MHSPVRRSFYARFGWPILMVMAALTPVFLWGVRGTFSRANNAIYQWLPERFDETRQYEEFRQRFETDEFAVVSWDGCTLDDPRLEEFAQRCERLEWVASVTTGPRLLKTLMDEPLGLSREEALVRLEGALVGTDHRTTCALATMSEAGDTHRVAVLEALRQTAHDSGVDLKSLHLTGDTVTNAAIDIESRRAITHWIVPAWVVSLAVAWVCLRSPKLMAMIFVAAGYSAMVATATIYFTGGTMNLLLVVVPVLIYVLPLSAAVHLSNYYCDAVREAGLAGAPVRAAAAGWTPCLLSAVTTAVGLISLVVSRILPVRLFGIYSAVGILASLIVLFGAFPVALEFWPPYGRRPPGGASGAAPAGRVEALIDRWAGWLIAHRRAMVALSLGTMLLLGAGALRINTTITPSRFFPAESQWARDARWFQENLGATLPIEILVAFDKDCRLSYLDRMELLQEVDRTLRAFEEVGSTISPATFAPASFVAPEASASDTPFGQTSRAMLSVLGLGNSDVIRRRILSEQIRRSRGRLVEAKYMHVGPDEEIWRISARVRAFGEMDHGRFVHQQVKQKVDAVVDAWPGAEGTVRAIYTGIVPLVYVAQRELLDGLYRSFCLAFAMIALVMLLLLRDPRSAGLAMLPNLLPALVVFGAMGWLGTLIDVGTMMTASVALGIAVDDTLHFLIWFRRAVGRGQTRGEAVAEAYRRCAPAMVQTTLIAGLGQVVFAMSTFQPVARFGLMMFLLLAAALLGDLILLPALLATRLGRYFEARG